MKIKKISLKKKIFISFLIFLEYLNILKINILIIRKLIYIFQEDEGAKIGGNIKKKFEENVENPMSDINVKDYQNTVTKADKKNLELFEKFVRSNKEIIEVENQPLGRDRDLY